VRIADRMPHRLLRTGLALVILSVLLGAGVAVAKYLHDVDNTNSLDAQPTDPASAGPGSQDPMASASASASVSPSGTSSTKPGVTSGGARVVPSSFPNAADTGVPAGVPLKAMTGVLVIRENGTVIDAVNLVGKVVVAANNVTIKRSRITAPTNLPDKGRDEFTVIQQMTNVDGLVLQDCELDGSGLVYRAVMASSHLSVTRCEMRNIGHGVEVGNDYTIQDSWIHATTDGPDHDWHVDGIISSNGVNGVIRHNTIVLTGDGMTGAVSVGSSLGRIDNVLIQGNLLAGGNYTVYIQDQGHPATRIRVLDNLFSTMVGKKVGVYGVWYPNDQPGDLVRQGNKVYETGVPADREPNWG
jgi:hypothetical protein